MQQLFIIIVLTINIHNCFFNATHKVQVKPTIFWTRVCLSSISFLSTVNWVDISSNCIILKHTESS